jgi:hypothetical protein
MNLPLIVAGSLALVAAAVHGVGGEVLVVRKLSVGTLPSTRFGGARMTKAMIHVSWHIATIAFLTAGIALLLSGSVLDGDAAQAVSIVTAGASTGFAAITIGLGAAYNRSARALLHHPGPVALAAIAALAWWGSL